MIKYKLNIEYMPIDYKRYPPNWKTEIRPAILERANNCCEHCEVENYSIRDNKRVVLTIAHLDHDEDNWDVEYDRLAALCQRCHLRYDAAEKARRRKLNKNQLKLNI